MPVARNTPSNPPTDRQVSLRRRFYGVLWGVAALFAAGMTLSLIFSLHVRDVAEERMLKVEATQAYSSIMRRWDYYQQLVDNLAQDQALPPLLLHGSVERQQEWTRARQHLLPNIAAVALMTPRGDIISHTRMPGMHDGYRTNFRKYGMDAAKKIMVHRAGSDRGYINLTSVVKNEHGTVLAKLFLSIALESLQRVIDESTQPGHAILLRDAAGAVIVSHGALSVVEHEIARPLPAMGWQLVVQSPSSPLSYETWLQILAGFLTLAGVLILLIFVMIRMRRPIMQDVESVLEALRCLARDEPAPAVKTNYSEFVPAVTAINRLAQQLHDQRGQLATLSLTDALTGLPNRRAFESQFPHMLGLADRGHTIALVLLDVDHFKAINDQFGHAAGDRALVAVSTTLKALSRSADMTARLAGDEFTVLLAGLDEAGVMAWYARLADRFRRELRASGLTVDATMSAGHTWLHSMTGDSIGKALARADYALYQAKARGRGQLVLDEAAPAKDAG